jgi:hypothetical protein
VEIALDFRIGEEKLNHRPRKVLGYKTPYEVFFGKITEWIDDSKTTIKMKLSHLIIE